MRAHAGAGRLVAGLAILAFTVLAALLPSSARAAGCPNPWPITVANGGSYQIDASGCDPFGINPISFVVQPTHGSVTIQNAALGLLTYIHNGDSSTSDSFTFQDASARVIAVNVTILPGTSPLTIAPATLPAPAISVSYSQGLTTTGGVAPYSYAVSSGSLPAGLSLSSSGTISGTPTQSGSFAFTVSVTDSTSGTALTGSKSYSFTVAAPTLSVSPTSLVAGSRNFAYGQQFQTSGGTAPYTYTLISGSLPAGMTLDGSGLLHGTPTVTGSFPITIRSQDSTTFVAGGAAFTDVNLTLTINAAPTIALSPASLTSATVAQAYSATITASGGSGPYTYAITAGALPAGLALSTSGTITGTPSAGGSFNFTVTATDSSAAPGPYSGSKSYSLNVLSPTISMSPATLPSGTAGTPYNQTVTAGGGTAPFTYAVTAGRLPNGLTLATNGSLTGTPTEAGPFSFTITATDSSTGTGPFTGSRAYSLSIAAPAITVAPASLPNATRSIAYSQTVTASGGTAPYSFAVTSGALPPGFTLSGGGSSVTLAGTPAVTGSYNFTITATDSTGAGFAGSSAYSFTIDAPTIVVSPPSLPGGAAGTAYAQGLTASGGAAPYDFAVTSGALPPGLVLSSFPGGLASVNGIPTTPGAYNFTVTAVDLNGLGAGGSQNYTIAITAPTITLTPAVPNATAGTAYSQTVTASGGTGPYSFAVSAGSLPPGLTLAANGVLSGTPTDANTFSFTIEATDAYNFKGTQAYTIAVTANPPTATAKTAQTLDGQAVTVDVGGGSGSVTSATIATPPANGTASVSGTSITYTPNAAFTGTDTLAFTLTGPGGTSSPAPLTITVNPRPVASAQQLSTASAAPVTADLRLNASGGPFTAATLVAAPPASTGTVALDGFALTFTPAPAFSGTATVSFTLSNAYATSAAAAITITVAQRPDPTRDADVMGLLNAQAAATRRFASSQIGNFQSRLEALHDFGGSDEITEGAAFVQGVTIAMDSRCGAFDPVAQAAPSCANVQPAADPGWRSPTGPRVAAAAGTDGRSSAGNGHSRFTVWTGGSIDFGDGDGFDFQTAGLSAGIDYRLTRDIVLGVGGGYGRDTSDVGNDGSRSTGSSYTAAIYGSYQPGRYLFFDGVAGYQWLSFDPERYVASTGGSAGGQRDGGQWFGSVSAGGKFALDAWRFTPYARLDVARANLDAYTEDGDPAAALHYDQQDIYTTTGNLGLTVDYDYVASFGTVSPQLRLQYQHDFQSDSGVTMSYADLIDGPFYSATLSGLGQDRLLLGAGLNVTTVDNIALRLEYRALLGSGGDTDNSLLLNLGASF